MNTSLETLMTRALVAINDILKNDRFTRNEVLQALGKVAVAVEEAKEEIWADVNALPEVEKRPSRALKSDQ